MNETLPLIDFAALSPLLILFSGALVMLLLESFFREEVKKSLPFLCLGFIVAASVATLSAPASSHPLLTPWLYFDSLSRFLNLFFLMIGVAVTLLSISFFRRFSTTQGEYYFLLLSALFGLMMIGQGADFLTLFLGVEILAISLYVFCAYMKEWQASSESAIKYFLMGALGTAFMLYGIALIYGAVGTTALPGLLEKYQHLASDQNRIIFLGGIALVTLGLAFEAAIVPFHLWAPDVYAGAPTPVTAFMAVGTKVGAFAAFIRIFFYALPGFDPLWNEGIAWLIYPTLIYANLVALKQVQLRRFFAYSGISHAGFLLIPLVAGTPEALTALMFYLVVYAFATLGAFAVLSLLDMNSQGAMLNDLRGLFVKSPLLASIFAICLLTLAGIPPTVGFFAKFYLFKVAFQAEFYGIVIVGLVTAVLSVFYYLRLIGIMCSGAFFEGMQIKKSRSSLIVGGIATVALVISSFYPEFLLQLSQKV